MKKVSTEVWTTAQANLQKRRDVTGLPDPKTKPYYCELLQKCYVGKTLLDVGCGNQQLKSCLSETEYFGMDAFPIVEGTIEVAIDEINEFWFSHELNTSIGKPIETVCAFAVLDGVRDFSLACQNMKLIAEKNIIILTGIGIEVDPLHTLKLELEDFRTEFHNWKETVCHIVSPKLYLLDYQRI